MTRKHTHLKKIKFQPYEFELNVRNLLNEITTIRSNTSLKPTHQQKFDDWIKQLRIILNQISTIEQKIIPRISKDLGYHFSNKNLVVTAMLQPSLKNTFDEINKQFETELGTGISDDMLKKLAAGPEAARSLAWVGDMALQYLIS
ncbi:MAG: hypothetical protein ABFC71_09745 [Methanoregula sp.]